MKYMLIITALLLAACASHPKQCSDPIPTFEDCWSKYAPMWATDSLTKSDFVDLVEGCQDYRGILELNREIRGCK